MVSASGEEGTHAGFPDGYAYPNIPCGNALVYYNHGIYIGARFSLSSEDDIVWWAQENQIDVKRENLHVTVFSAAYPGGYYDPPPFKSIRIPECKVIKSGPNKNFVVLAFEAPELVDRHFFAKKTLVSNYPFPGS